MVARRPTRARTAEHDVAALRRATSTEDLVAHFGTRKAAWAAYLVNEHRLRGLPGTRPEAFWLLAAAPEKLRVAPTGPAAGPVASETEARRILEDRIAADQAFRLARREWLGKHGGEADRLAYERMTTVAQSDQGGTL